VNWRPEFTTERNHPSAHAFERHSSGEQRMMRIVTASSSERGLRRNAPFGAHAGHDEWSFDGSELSDEDLTISGAHALDHLAGGGFVQNTRFDREERQIAHDAIR
jgi:hypothetical protein